MIKNEWIPNLNIYRSEIHGPGLARSRHSRRFETFLDDHTYILLISDRNDTLDSNFEDSFRALSTIHDQLRCIEANIKYLSNFCQIDTDLVKTNLTRLENQLKKLKETALFIQSATDQYPTQMLQSYI